MISAAELGGILQRVEQGLTTEKDAKALMEVLRELSEQVQLLIAIIEKEIDSEQEHGACARLFDGAGTA